MVTKPINIESLQNAIRINKASGSGAFVEYIALDPHAAHLIQIEKNGLAIDVELTNAALTVAGQLITDFETDDAVFFNVQDTNTDDYFKGDNRLITCLRVSGDPVGNDVNITVIQTGIHKPHSSLGA